MAKILVVDDDANVQRTLRYNLEQEGYQVIQATDGAEGFRLWGSEAPDLILLDVMLPKLDGYRVCRLLKFDKSYRDIPIVMLTAKAEDAAVATGLRTGADQYLTKPVEPDTLLSAVAAELSRARSEQP